MTRVSVFAPNGAFVGTADLNSEIDRQWIQRNNLICKSGRFVRTRKVGNYYV